MDIESTGTEKYLYIQYLIIHHHSSGDIRHPEYKEIAKRYFYTVKDINIGKQID